jgi:hypothetical protein
MLGKDSGGRGQACKLRFTGTRRFCRRFLERHQNYLFRSTEKPLGEQVTSDGATQTGGPTCYRQVIPLGWFLVSDCSALFNSLTSQSPQCYTSAAP